MFIGAMMAFGLPTVAIHPVEITAMSGKWPTIVKGPNHRLFGLSKVFKKDSHMQVIAMQVVQVNDVRVNCTNLVSQLSGSCSRGKAVIVEQTGLQGMHITVGFIPYRNHL